jgi:hypothetical protein
MHERLYNEKKLYTATVTGQILTSSKSGDPQFRLEIELDGMCKTSNPSDGVEDLEENLKGSRTIFFTFNPDPTRMSRCFRDLAIIGLDDADIGRLDPDNPKGLKLLNKKIFVRCRYSPSRDGEGETDWWNLASPPQPPKKLSAEQLKAFSVDNKAAIKDAFDRRNEPATPF